MWKSVFLPLAHISLPTYSRSETLSRSGFRQCDGRPDFAALTECQTHPHLPSGHWGSSWGWRGGVCAPRFRADHNGQRCTVLTGSTRTHAHTYARTHTRAHTHTHARTHTHTGPFLCNGSLPPHSEGDSQCLGTVLSPTGLGVCALLRKKRQSFGSPRAAPVPFLLLDRTLAGRGALPEKGRTDGHSATLCEEAGQWHPFCQKPSRISCFPSLRVNFTFGVKLFLGIWNFLFLISLRIEGRYPMGYL